MAAAQSFLIRVSRSMSNYIGSAFRIRHLVTRSPWESNRTSPVSLTTQSGIHTSSVRCDLKEFFDEEKNWGEQKIITGRPWRKDELRLKSNTDLHKLWYILLKERNMIMTMEAEYERECELFPHPERVYKVEESMENLLDVIAERDNAYSMLETGETAHAERRWGYNALGMGHWRLEKEHYVPAHMHTGNRDMYRLHGRWMLVFKRLLREKRQRAKRNWQYRYSQYINNLKKTYPEVEVEEMEQKLQESKKSNVA